MRPFRPAVYTAALIAGSFIAHGATAAGSPIAYTGYFSGFRVAGITLDLEHEAAAYHGSMEIDARGLLGVFLTWAGGVDANGTIAADGSLKPAAYSTHWADSQKHGKATVIFDPKTGDASSLWDGKPDTSTPPALLHNVLDPVSVVFALQKTVLSAGPHAPVTLPVYDGRRRADVHVTYGAPYVQALWDRQFKVIPVVTTFTPISGFNRYQQETWPKVKTTLLFADDAAAEPLQIKVEMPIGTAIMTITCAEDDPGTPCPAAVK